MNVVADCPEAPGGAVANQSAAIAEIAAARRSCSSPRGRASIALMNETYGDSAGQTRSVPSTGHFPMRANQSSSLCLLRLPTYAWGGKSDAMKIVGKISTTLPLTRLLVRVSGRCPAAWSATTTLRVLARNLEVGAVGQGLNRKRRRADDAKGPRIKKCSTSRTFALLLAAAKEPSTQNVAVLGFSRRISENTNVSAPSASRTTGTDSLATAFVARSRITTPVERLTCLKPTSMPTAMSTFTRPGLSRGG